jgi:YjbE family integral membrane protein
LIDAALDLPAFFAGSGDAFASAEFWLALGEIIWINLLLSGDNAVVIALAARNLPPDQRTKAIVGGSAGAIVLRVALTVFALRLLDYPYLKLIGAVLLLWIGAQLLLPEAPEDGRIRPAEHLWTAVRTILLADLVMSVDNVLAIAAAAEAGPASSRLLLLVLGLGLSIPLIVFSSQLLLRLMERFPIFITLGAALLGYVAAELVLSDAATAPFFDTLPGWFTGLFKLACAGAVVLIGRFWAQHRRRALC